MHKHKFNPAHIERLLSEDRARETPPLDVLKAAGLKAGDCMADVGCGPGFYALPASGAVGPTGKVYAIDTQEEMLNVLKKRNPPQNVVSLKSDEGRIPLEDGATDFALLGYMLHEAEAPADFLKEVRRIMKAGARLCVLDWKRKVEAHGPPMRERLSKAKAVRLIRDAGFSPVSLSSLTRSHFRILARKPKA